MKTYVAKFIFDKEEDIVELMIPDDVDYFTVQETIRETKEKLVKELDKEGIYDMFSTDFLLNEVALKTGWNYSYINALVTFNLN